MKRWAIACDGKHSETLYMVDQSRYPEAGWWTEDPTKKQRFRQLDEAKRTLARLRYNNPRIIPCR